MDDALAAVKHLLSKEATEVQQVQEAIAQAPPVKSKKLGELLHKHIQHLTQILANYKDNLAKVCASATILQSCMRLSW